MSTRFVDLSKELTGRRALVTGGTRGIGAAITQRFLNAGAEVVVAARSRSDTTPASATFIPGDVSTVQGVEAIAAETLSVLGGIDIVVNNAGGSRFFNEGATSIPDEEWQSTLALNLMSAIRLTNALLPALRESKAASVVNISSTAATMPFGAVAHYGAAKAALDYYSRTLATELAPHGVRVNVVSPGPISTPSADALRSNFPGVSSDEWLQYVPLGRIGDPDDIAEVVALLASDRGKFLTGVNYRVDGGLTAR